MGVVFDRIIGNRSLTDRLSRDITDSSLAHAYIIEGPFGSGRHTLAINIAAALACQKKDSSLSNVPCCKCKNCKKIFEGKSSDIITVGLEEDRATISVDAIRDIKNDIYTEPNDLGIKVYIIENAECLTAQAQNAFLLSLEDPPPYVLFFLICENSTSLLETVRSRAPSLRIQRLTYEQVEGYLLSNHSRARQLKDENPEQLRSAIFASAGCIGSAIELLDSKKRKAVLDVKQVSRNIISMVSVSDKAGTIDIISRLGKNRSDVRRQLISLQEAIRDLILLKKCQSVPLCFFEEADDAAELATHFSSVSLFALYDASVEAIDALDAGANVRLTLVSMMQKSGLI